MIWLGIISSQAGVKPPAIWVSMEELGSGSQLSRIYTANFKNENTASGTLYYSTNGGSSYSNTSISANETFGVTVLLLRRGESGTINLKAYLIINGQKSPTVSDTGTYSFPLEL